MGIDNVQTDEGEVKKVVYPAQLDELRDSIIIAKTSLSAVDSLGEIDSVTIKDVDEALTKALSRVVHMDRHFESKSKV